MLNGLWLKSICPVSSFSSYIGKSVIQQKRNAPCSTSPRSVPSLVRTAPANFARLVRLAGGEEHRVARRRRPQAARIAAARSGSRLRAIGPLAPSASKMM